MPTATYIDRGSGTPATTGTTWASVANVVDGTPPANPATYATMTNATASAVATIEVTGYDFATALPADVDAVLSVTVRVRHFESATARFAGVQYQPFDGATAIGTIATATLGTAAADTGGTFPVTLAQLKSATFKVRVTITGAASTQSRVFNLDHVDVVVLYGQPGGPKAATLVDQFTSISGSVWTSGGTPTIASGQLQLDTTTVTDSIQSVGSDYDISNSSLTVKIAPFGAPTSLTFDRTFSLMMYYDATNYVMAQLFHGAGGVVGTRYLRVVSQEGAATTIGTWFTFNATTQYIRLRNDGTTTFYVEWSVDGVAWNAGTSWAMSQTTLDKAKHSFIRLEAKQTAADVTGAPLYVLIDTLNSVLGAAAGRPKVYVASVFTAKPLKVWTGSTWVEKPVKVWTGSTWKTLT
jgi:hypothetical protein